MRGSFHCWRWAPRFATSGLFLAAAFLCFNLGTPNLWADVVISEFAAMNLAGVRDEEGETADWIEIHNNGTGAVNLQGWALTDDGEKKAKWKFPARVLSPGEFLVVFASGKDRRKEGGQLHTNFKLDGAGEYLALFNNDSPGRATTEFNPGFPEQRKDLSYGSAGGPGWRFFEKPTPGAGNGPSAILGVAPAPRFSVERGLYDSPLALRMSVDLAGASIRFTTDGSEPTATTGASYTADLQITNTTIIRAAAFKEGYLPSRTLTHSYIFLGQVLQQPKDPPGFPKSWGRSSWFPDRVVPADYELDLDPLRQNPNDANSPIDPAKRKRFEEGMREWPIVSLVLKTDDMFGQGGLYPEAREATVKPSNEKHCSVEMLLPGGEPGFAVNCGIDLHGNASRNPGKNPKHGFKLAFKEQFGETSLRYRLFPESPAEEFDDLILRPDFGVSWRHWSDTEENPQGSFQRTRAARIRDPWLKDSMRDMGGIASYNRFCHLFINGLYWGTYDFTEQPTDSFARNYFGGEKEEYDIYDQGTRKSGTEKAYQLMQEISDLEKPGNYELMKRFLNVPEFIDYMLLHLFVGHQDWGYQKNWYAIRRHEGSPGGKFRFIPWDGESVLLDVEGDRVRYADTPAGLHVKLLRSAEYLLDFADRIYKHMIAPDGALTSAANSARWRKWQALLDKPIVAESVRWGDYRRDVHPFAEGGFDLYTREAHWLPEIERVATTYFPKRNEVVLNQFRRAGLYPKLEAPVFNQRGGQINSAFGLTISATKGKIYYTTNGADPRQSGTGKVAPDALVYGGPVLLKNDTFVRARVLDGKTWSAVNEATFTTRTLGVPLRITRIMYHPPEGKAEFIQVKNVGAAPLDVSQFRFTGITYIFPDAVLQPGEQATLVSASATNAAVGMTIPGEFRGSLNNGGERIGILDRRGRVVTSVQYDDANGWPTEADGRGAYLEAVDPFGEPNAASNWRAIGASAGR